MTDDPEKKGTRRPGQPDPDDTELPDPEGPSKGAGRKHDVQKPPEEQRGRPDPKEGGATP